MKIIILDKKTVTEGDLSLEPITKLGEVVSYDLTEKDQLLDHIGDADIVLCNKIVITGDVIRSCNNLKYIGVLATGYNNVDLEAAKERGIIVCNAPSYSTDAVAQHTFSLLLHITNQIGRYSQSVMEGNWIHSKTFSYFPYPIQEIAGTTMGIIGYGSIGRKVTSIAKAFGMNVVVYTRTQRKEDGITFVSLEELLKESDFISIHCPLTEETRGLISKEQIEKMKNTAVLINTSRGPIVNEKDLAEALNQNQIAGAALDVLSREPMRADNPLKDAKNCVITPHIAWAPLKTRERLINIVADNILHYLKGDPINVVNP